MTAASVAHERFGRLPSGEQVQRATLQNRAGMTVQVLSYGGIIQSLTVPDALEQIANVVLGFATLDGYLDGSPYFGAIIGRYANRIHEGKLPIDGVTYQLQANDQSHSLHGGPAGFDKQNWAMRALDSGDCGVKLSLTSRDGDGGFPGTLRATVLYELADDANTLRISYRATTDAATVVNMTGHSYFNLAGEGSGTALGHVLQVDADAYLPVTDSLVPTGELRPVAGTPFDFRTPHSIDERIRAGDRQLQLGRGFDHNYVLRRDVGNTHLQRAARLTDPLSRRALEVWTTEPGLDVYTGNLLDGTIIGASGKAYRQGDAVALEPEHFTNSPNMSQFPSTILLPGEIYESRTEYRFGFESN